MMPDDDRDPDLDPQTPMGGAGAAGALRRQADGSYLAYSYPMPEDYRDYLLPPPDAPRPDRALATTFLRGQFVEHQADTPEQWAAWRNALPFRWAQALVDQWWAEQQP